MTRSHVALGALAAAAGIVAALFTWQSGLASLFDDSVSYLVMAQAFSPFTTASAAVAAALPQEKYPPLFPLLLALGGGAYEWRIAHLWVALAFAASVYFLGLHAGKATGSAALGWAAALVFAWMPGVWLNVKGILSEFPFMALTFATLAYYERLRARPATRRGYVGLGVLLAAVMLTRTIGIALVAAVAAAEAWRFVTARERDRLRLASWALAIPILAAGLWYALRPKGGEDAYVAFSTGMAQGAAEHGTDWALGIMGLNISALADAWLTAILIFWGEAWRPGFLIATLVGASGAIGTLWRAARGEADGLYVLAFIAILVAWPFPGQMYRLALPVLPLLVVHALWTWQHLLARVAGEPRARAWTPFASILPLLACVPAVLFYIAERARDPGDVVALGYRNGDIAEFYRIPDRKSAEANALQQIEIFEDMEQIRRTTPESARVMWYAPGYVALLAGRRGVPLERRESLADMAAQMRAAKPDYIYFAAAHPRDSARRLGDPLDAIGAALPFSDGLWQRVNARGGLESILLKVDPARIPRSP
jgi:4-amino-4-deoxy-L-arabinose transferase-like glycosyltransferase